MNSLTRAAALLALFWGVAQGDDEIELDPARLEAAGMVVGDIILDKRNVFDLSNPAENNFLYRWANRLHILTRDSVIEKQLLLQPGDVYSKRLSDETERILRGNTYFYEASITPVAAEDGKVDLRVTTHDVWTLKPGLSLSRSGGENRSSISLEDLNLLGYGQQLFVSRSDDVDRESTTFEYQDRHIGDQWVAGRLSLADNSDGHSNLISLERPFYALDARWTAGVSLFDDDREDRLYSLGEQAAEFRQQRQLVTAFGGWSAGVQNGWVRRYTTGIVYDENDFSVSRDPTLPAAIPEDRKLVYPFIGIEILEDSFTEAHNREQIDRTEDFQTGLRFSASLGFASEDFESDRDALLYRVQASRVLGDLDDRALLLRSQASGRFESGNTVNALWSVDARYYHRQSDKRLFFAHVAGTWGHDLDLDNPLYLGGDTGLRGYPLRYQTGDSRFLATIEQRYFTDWYPFRLFRVGGAVFFDVGRTWGQNPLGDDNRGWLRDAGFGLRFAPTRTGSRRVVHLDIAFPLDGDADIDDVQILLESKSSF